VAYKNKKAEVKIRKEILKEEKYIKVPVTREELVIEQRENVNGFGGKNETIRIPISEECIEVTKYPVTLADISIYKHQIEDIQHIEETMKSETLRVKKTGNVNVIEKKIEEQQ